MNDIRSQWQTEALARNYLEGVRGAIPAAKLQLEVIAKIISIWCPNPKTVIDLGCGDGILGRMILQQYPESNITFLDFSDPMLDAVRGKVKDSPGVKVVKADFSSPAWLDSISKDKPYELVISGFAIHHLKDERKKSLYSEIYNILSDHGLFLNLEHIASITTEIEKLYDSYFIDYLTKFHKSDTQPKAREEIEQSYHNRDDKKENILAPVQLQCDWLREIGFKDVDCHFKIFELAIFGGRKIV